MQPEWQPIFCSYSLRDETTSRLAQAVIERRYLSGEIVQLEGDACSGVYWVLSGELCLFRIAFDGREMVMARLRRGEVFNLVPPFETEPICRAGVRAVSDVSLLYLPLERFHRLIADCPDFAVALLKLFAARLSHLNRVVEQMALHTVRGRLARFLLDQADGKLPLRQYTQDEIAQSLGTVRDVVGRTLRSFEDAGLIRRDRSRILLRDRAGLEHEAQR
ncbi:MAG TPA: Crp/Fnr family transcriptional regulator [Chloroflexi bacterium]|nr:Crp/Fnr family transcriptional regulator [Chloroflexota bacterium]